MLCLTVGNELWLLQATPRRRLNDGEKIEVRDLQTEFGPISFAVRSTLASGSVQASISPPQRRPVDRLKVRFRAP